MADLRNSFDVNVTNGQLPQLQEEATANGMGALRRSWNTGQLGSEANYLAAQELGLRNEGRHTEADALRAKIGALQQRQQLYAPQVGRVEDIGGDLSRGLDWAATQIGQGAASMTDPLAIGVGVNAAGRAAGMVKNPLAQAFSKAAPYLAGVGAYGVNQRQLTGEIGNEMAADPELMANTTAHQRYVDANTYGAGAAALDTLLPAHIAGKVVGKGTVGAITKRAGLAGELGMEGATELGQEYGSQQVQNQLNPNRDTSGDNSALLNSFAGGAVGAGGPVAVGAGAERLHGMAHKTVDAVGEKAGDMVDLANGAATAAKDKGKGFLGGAKALFGKTEATDLGGAEKSPSKGPAEAPAGAPAGFSLTPDELDTLDPNAGGADPTGPEFMDHVMRRADFVKQKLGSLAESHPEAAQLYAQLTNPSSPEAEFDAADRGAILLHQMHDQDALDAKGKAMEQNLKALGSMAGRGVAAVAKGVAKGAATVGKAAWEGATSKKNEQAQDPHAADLAEKFAAHVAAEKNDSRTGVVALARHMVRQLTSAGANAGSTNRNALLNRVASVVQKTYREDAQTVLDEVSKIMGSKGAQAINYVKREVEALSGPQGRLHERQQRHALADQLISLVPHEKEAALASQGINIRMGADRDKLLSLMEDYVDGASDPGLRRRLNDVFGHETVNKMVAHLNSADIAEGKDERTAKESTAFAESSHEQEIMGEGFDVSDDGEITDYEKRQGDKQVSKSGAPKLYGFKNTQTLRNSADWGNPLAGARVSKEAMRKWHESVEESKTLGVEPPEDPRVAAAAQRPSLFGKDDTLTDGRNAIQARIEHMTQKLGDKASSWSVSAKQASKILDEAGASDTARVAMYRDYLRKALGSKKGTVEQKAKWKNEIGVLGRVLKDMVDGSHIDREANVADRSTEDDEATSGIHSLRKKRMTAQAAAARSATDPEAKKFSAEAHARTGAKRSTATASSPQERRDALTRTKRYLESRYIVVAEDMTNRAPEDISTTEVESMSRTGATAMDNARKITSMVESRIKKAGLTGAEANQMRKDAQREYNEVVDAYNLLEFAPADGSDKPVYIKAGDLVYWARTQRNKSETVTEDNASYGRNAQDREYLSDLMTGISTILASGLVGARLPTKRNKFGVEEAFEIPQQGKGGRKPRVIDSVPDSLRLVTMTAGQMRWKPETPDTRGPEWDGPPDMTAGGDARADEDYQAAVIRDQMRREGPAVVDPLRDSGEMRPLDPQDYAALTPGERATLNDFAERYSKAEGATKNEIAREQREFLNELNLRKDGARYSTAADTTSSERQRGMTEHAEVVNAKNGVKPSKLYAGETHRAVYKDEAREASQIRRGRRMRNADGTKRTVFVEGAENPVEMTDDEISPLDFFPDQEPGAVPDEFADAQFRNRIEGYDASTTVSAEFKLSAASKAEVRGLAIRSKLMADPGKGSEELTPKQLEGINEIAARIRSAYRPERRERGDAGLVGGWHYLYPVARALNTDFLRNMAQGGKDSADLMPTLKFLRDQFKRALLDSAATPSQKAAVLRVASPAEWASKITAENVNQLLERDAPARDEAFDTSSEQRAAMLDAAPEVAAQAPKSQSAPAGARVDLGNAGKYGAKDQAKSDRANKFIGRGSEASSTAKYAKAWGERANAGKYTSSDVVFVSAEGNRNGRVAPDLAEVGRAVNARATIVTDDKANREREYNVGEREVAKFLHDSGYREVAPGQWKPGKLNSQGKVVDLGKIRGDRMMARAKDIISQLSGEDFDTLQNDVLSLDPSRRKMPSALKESFREWLREYHPIERESMMAHENLAGTEERFYEEVVDTSDVPLERALAQAMLSGATMSVAPAGARKLNAMSSMSLDDKLTSVLAERGIVVTRDALEGMPTEDRISLVSRTLRTDPSQTMAPDVARFVSWMVVGSDFYSRVDAGIAGTQMEKDIMAKVDRDPRQSLYIPTRKRREVVRQAVEQLLTYGLYKRYAQEGTLSQKLVAVVKEAARYAIEALGGVPFRFLQAEADRLVDGILSGEVKLERPRKEGSVLMDPNKAFAEDQHAANIVYGLTEGGGFALTGSLAYAAQGTVYRPAGVPIHDLDLTTNLSQKSAEARLTRLYPQAELVRSFGGLGSFVTTYVVPPKGYTVSDVAAENGAIKGYTVRQGGKVVGRYEHTDKGETQSGVRATVVDLIGDTRKDYASMVIPTAFGDKRVPVSHYRDAMTEKLVYARDKDITDFVNFVPHDRKLNAMSSMSREDIEEQIMAALEIHGEQFADGLPSAQRDEFMSLLDEAMSASRDELTGELSTGSVNLGAAKQLAEKYDVPTLRHWVNQLGDATRNDQAFPNAGPNRVASQAEMDAARAYLKKIAPDVKLAFKDITGYSGEFIEAENAIEISTTSPAGVMEVAYHEALHKFFSQFVKSDPKVFAALRALAENQRLIERVHALLKGYPAAQRQLADGEERLAYIFQFWAAGKLDLPVGRPTTIMQKIRKFFRRVAGMISKEERAADLLHAFHNGELSEPSAAGRVIADIMNQGTFTPKQLRRMDKLVQGAAGLVVPSETILAKSESAAARALAKEFYTNPGDETSAGHGEGLLNATRTTAAKNVNRFAGAIRGLSDRDLADVARYMQQGTEVSDIPYAPHREAVKAIRQHLSEFYDYMTDRGMKMGKINEKYFPVSWSLNKLTLEADKFKKMLTDNYADKLDEAVNAARVPMTRDDVAGRIWQALIDRNGTDGKIDVTRDDGVLAPFFANSEHRELNWIKPEHSEPFLHKNLVSIMTGYIHQGVKAAEYTERFGRDGKLLDDKLTEVHNELKEIALAKLNAQEFDGKQQADDWVEGQMKNIKRATGAMEGSLGKDISPALRKFNSWMMVYQNLRLLPLTLFASFVDPLGMVARGATMKEAYETFLRGMREVFTGWADMIRDTPKERQADKWELLAEHIGALDAIMLSHHVSEEYSSTYLSGGAKKINDTLFKLNGMEAWNRGVRAGAVRSAVKFIARHSKLPEVHSKRWLAELSLTDDHIALDNDGELILDADELAKAKGISVPEAKRRVEALHSAINRWVVGAVLTPNSAQRPAWASDPHYSVFFHLKQFSYSFHQTILKRAVQEMNHGNLAPIGAFAGYIPVMIASDVVKGLIVGGGELPDYMKSYNLGDWVKHGMERSGTLGIAGIGVDASHDIFSLAGPGVEQVMDAMGDPIGQTTLNALPVHGLYAGLLK